MPRTRRPRGGGKVLDARSPSGTPKVVDQRALPLLEVMSGLGEKDKNDAAPGAGADRRPTGPEGRRGGPGRQGSGPQRGGLAGALQLARRQRGPAAGRVGPGGQGSGRSQAARRRLDPRRPAARQAARGGAAGDAQEGDGAGLQRRAEDRWSSSGPARSARWKRSASWRPTWTSPRSPRSACETVVELAHHKDLRQPNKAEFNKALDKVLALSKDPEVILRAKHYLKDQTWVEKQIQK